MPNLLCLLSCFVIVIQPSSSAWLFSASSPASKDNEHLEREKRELLEMEFVKLKEQSERAIAEKNQELDTMRESQHGKYIRNKVAELKRLNSVHQGELKEVRSNHQEEIQKKDAKLKTLQSNHGERLERLTIKHQEQLEEMKNQAVRQQSKHQMDLKQVKMREMHNFKLIKKRWKESKTKQIECKLSMRRN